MAEHGGLVADAARSVPASTYRLQLHAGFGFRAAAAQADYLASLGVTHAYLSPILQAAPGSTHGYDVVDHSAVSAELGGEAAFREMAAAFAGHGIGVVADIVPNHMAVPVPEYLNRQLWSVLRDGQDSLYAHWFDVDWSAHGGRMLLPILAVPTPYCLGELTVRRVSALPDPAAAQFLAAGEEQVLCYRDHVLPLRPGTAGLPMRDLLAAQCYRLDSWGSGGARLNWRRFFDIASLIAIRVEEPDVFAATHGLVLGLVAEGVISGLRVDHPDGLADPARYLRQLEVATSGAWVVAEKVLAAGEELPADWECAGTTGYDSLAAVGRLLTDPAGAKALRREYTEATGGAADFAPVAWTARRETASDQLAAEVARLARLLVQADEPVLRGVGLADLRLLAGELLAAFEVYRAYVVPGTPPPAASARQVSEAAGRARRRVPRRLHPALDAISAMLLGRGPTRDGEAAHDQLITLFQQACAAVQAKGVEDTAMYRWSRLLSSNEVGSSPGHPAADPGEFHEFATRLAADWPATMTTLSTHDTKRQEDVRARLAVIAETPAAWAREVSVWHQRARALAPGKLPDPDTEYLLWQTLVGAWPIEETRLADYMRKAMREAKTATSWADPDTGYETAVLDLVQAVVADEELAGRIAAFVSWLAPDAISNSLAAKIVQLTMPGVPDIYQGCEMGGLALVDPDNRRPVDFARHRRILAAVDETFPHRSVTGVAHAGVVADTGAATAVRPGAIGNAVARASLDVGKLLVSSRVLRLRRRHPDWFTGSYEPLATSGPASEHVVAFSRSGQSVTIATRMPAGLRRAGGWRDTSLRLPREPWLDLLTGAQHAGGEVRLADITAALPVALLIRSPAEAGATVRAGSTGEAAW